MELLNVLMPLLTNHVAMVTIQILHHQLNVHHVVLEHWYVYQLHKLQVVLMDII